MGLSLFADAGLASARAAAAAAPAVAPRTITLRMGAGKVIIRIPLVGAGEPHVLTLSPVKRSIYRGFPYDVQAACAIGSRARRRDNPDVKQAAGTDCTLRWSR